MENLAAPNEWQAQNGEWSHSNERDVSKRKYQKVAPLEHLRRRGLIEPEHVQAGNKFEKHYRGALGHDTRDIDMISGDPDVEHYQTYCSQMISAAKDQIGAVAFDAVRNLIIEENPVAYIGYRTQALRSQPIRRGKNSCQRIGMEIVCEALDGLADHWGLLQQSASSRDRAA
jgi:hypothetical protein